MRKLIYLMLWTALSVGTTITLPQTGIWGEEKQHGRGFGMFSWSEDIMEEAERESLYACLDAAEVTDVYQKFSKESLGAERSAAFIGDMRVKEVNVFALMGEPEWAYEKDGKSLLQELGYVAEYNEAHEQSQRILGVMVDVEPYLLKEWKKGGETRRELMDGFLSCIKHAYAYAGEKDLKFWVCIPIFYDSSNEEILEELIGHGCDGVAVMNYSRRDEYGQMAKETGYAREYGRDIICIYELQPPGRHELEEINTYANEGLEALWQSARRLEGQFGYERLKFAYHHYEALKKALEAGN